MAIENQHGMVVDGHLGGYIPGGDPDTYYPDLWLWLVKEQGVRSVIDVGAGDGVAVRYFESLGCRVLGIDGIPQEHPSIIEHDFTLEPFAPAIADEQPDEFDLVWSCEFVEHVDEQFIGNFLVTFTCASLVLMTHAEPGQQGWHHVNCQDAPYWIERLDEVGFDLDPALTAETRILAARNHGQWNHYKRSGMAFRRREGMVL